MDKGAFEKHTQSTWDRFRGTVSRGDDIFGARLIEANAGSSTTAPGKMRTVHIPIPDLSKHPDGERINTIFERMEKQMGSNTRTYMLSEQKGDRSMQSACRRRETEIMGEFVAARQMVKRKARLLMDVHPGHGAGIDQLWKEKDTVRVVEAKGIGATLDSSRDQMSRQWVVSRIDRQTRSKDPERRSAAVVAQNALHRRKLIGETITAHARAGRVASRSVRYEPY